jgi:hypothetical protein
LGLVLSVILVVCATQANERFGTNVTKALDRLLSRTRTSSPQAQLILVGVSSREAGWVTMGLDTVSGYEGDFVFALRRDKYTDGVFGPTKIKVRLDFSVLTNNVSPVDMPELNRTVLDAICSELLIDAQEADALMRTGRIERQHAHVLGYVLNSCAYVALCLCVRGLLGVACVFFKRWRSWQATVRIGRGQCAQCGYSLIGLQHEQCPECGSTEVKGT